MERIGDMTIAAEIKALAHELGITQKELSEKARIGRASLSLKLNEHRDMTVSEVERLAAALGTTHKALVMRAEWADKLAGMSPAEYEIEEVKPGVFVIQARGVGGVGGVGGDGGDGGDAEGGL
jgi:DNA-binding helix-turn-helix protein